MILQVAIRGRWIKVTMGVLAALFVLSLMPTVAFGEGTADRVRATGVLRVGMEDVYPPFGFRDGDGALTGFDVDIAKEIARRLGVKVEFVPLEWTSLISALESDKVDVIIAQMSITAERKLRVDFTIPYSFVRTVMVTRPGDDRFLQLSDLAGAKVGVLEETTFETLARGVAGAVVSTYPRSDESIAALLTGVVDVIIEDQLVVSYFINQRELPLRIAPAILEEGRAGIAVKKGNQDFVDALNRILREMIGDGTYRRIYEKWFGAIESESLELLLQMPGPQEGDAHDPETRGAWAAE